MTKVYLLGTAYNYIENSRATLIEVLIKAERSEYPIIILEGYGWDGVGASFKPRDLLSSIYIEKFKITNTDWLIPLLKDAIENDDELDLDSVIESYKYIFGYEPNVRFI